MEQSGYYDEGQQAQPQMMHRYAIRPRRMYRVNREIDNSKCLDLCLARFVSIITLRIYVLTLYQNECSNRGSLHMILVSTECHLFATDLTSDAGMAQQQQMMRAQAMQQQPQMRMMPQYSQPMMQRPMQAMQQSMMQYPPQQNQMMMPQQYQQYGYR